MRHSLHSHVLYLESKLQSLRDRLTEPRLSSEEIQGLEVQIALAELALARYREAYALEISVASPEPPDSPGTDSNDGTGGQEGSSRGRRKNGISPGAAKVPRKGRLPWRPEASPWCRDYRQGLSRGGSR